MGLIGIFHTLIVVTHRMDDNQIPVPQDFQQLLLEQAGASGNLSWNLFDPSANSQELIDYISTAQETWISTDLSVLDYVVTGELGWYGYCCWASIP